MATNFQISPEQLLVEIEDVLRTAPSRIEMALDSPDNLAWRGRAAAAMSLWDGIEGISFGSDLTRADSSLEAISGPAYNAAMTALNKARSNLRMRVSGPTNIAIEQGRVFDYFDELRKVIEPARQEIFFIDRYLDAEFVSRYLPHAHLGTAVRLLTTAKATQQLVPAIEAFSKQNGLKISIRTSNSMHDRYLFIDRAQCYQSGASFKDGAKLSPTTLTQITDAFAPMLKTYEEMWDAALVVR